jgi:hypothetical protein
MRSDRWQTVARWGILIGDRHGILIGDRHRRSTLDRLEWGRSAGLGTGTVWDRLDWVDWGQAPLGCAGAGDRHQWRSFRYAGAGLGTDTGSGADGGQTSFALLFGIGWIGWIGDRHRWGELDRGQVRWIRGQTSFALDRGQTRRALDQCAGSGTDTVGVSWTGTGELDGGQTPLRVRSSEARIGDRHVVRWIRDGAGAGVGTGTVGVTVGVSWIGRRLDWRQAHVRGPMCYGPNCGRIFG